MRLSNAPSIKYDRATRGESGVVAAFDDSRAIDTWHHGPFTDHWRAVRDGKAVLIVDCGPCDSNCDVALGRMRGEVGVREFTYRRAETRIALLEK